MKKLIIFVCNGNIERSVIAAELLKKVLIENKIGGYEVGSYGLQGINGTGLPKHKNLSEYPDEWEASRQILGKLDCDITKHQFQTITPEVASVASVIIAMDDSVYQKAGNSLLNLFPKELNKIHNFSELGTQNEDTADLAGVSNRERHETMILKINKTIHDSYSKILAWAGN